MGDIFDRISPDAPGTPGTPGTAPGTTPAPAQAGASKGDIFDRIAPAKPNPTGVYGFLKGAVDTLNPIPLIKSAAHSYATTGNPLYEPLKNLGQSQLDVGKKSIDAFKQGRVSEGVGYGAAALLPAVGPAAAKAGEDIGNGDFAYGGGEAFGLLAPFGVKTGINAIASKAAPAVESSAQSTFSKALRPTGMKSRMLAKDVVAPEALKRGITAGSLDSLTDQATTGKLKAGANIDAQEQAIIQRQQANQVMAKLTAQNPSAIPGVQTHPIQPFVDALEDLRQGKGNTQGPTKVNGVVVNATKDAAIDKYQGVLKEMAKADPYGWPTDSLSEGALLEFRRALDEQIQSKHVVVPGTDTPAPLSVARPLSNVLREEFNKTHPDMAKAFQDYRFFKTFETLAKRAQTAQTGVTGWTESLGAIGTGITDFMTSHNPIESVAASAAFSALYRASRSTAWRTLSAATKHQMANAMANGQFALVVSTLQRVGSVAGAAGSDVQNVMDDPNNSYVGQSNGIPVYQHPNQTGQHK